jgi:hypothetical protein
MYSSPTIKLEEDLNKIILSCAIIILIGCSNKQSNSVSITHEQNNKLQDANNKTYLYGNTISISGQVTDFDGNPIDGCWVALYHEDFSTAYETVSDKTGHYVLNGVEKGRYLCMYALRLKEYPRENAVPDEDMRLEFWAWNVIADRDLTINPRYHRLELYGTYAFKTYSGIMIYTRPMSTGKILTYSKEVVLDKSLGEKVANISVKPEHFEVKVFADEKPLKVNSVQPIEEFGGDVLTITGYIIQADFPREKPEKPYVVIRVEAINTEENEKGENQFFYEWKDFN